MNHNLIFSFKILIYIPPYKYLYNVTYRLYADILTSSLIGSCLHSNNSPYWIKAMKAALLPLKNNDQGAVYWYSSCRLWVISVLLLFVPLPSTTNPSPNHHINLESPLYIHTLTCIYTVGAIILCLYFIS